jgi:hypothetical protein
MDIVEQLSLDGLRQDIDSMVPRPTEPASFAMLPARPELPLARWTASKARYRHPGRDQLFEGVCSTD